MTKNPTKFISFITTFIYFPTNTNTQSYVTAMKFNNSDHQKKATNNQDNLNLKYLKNYYFPF